MFYKTNIQLRGRLNIDRRQLIGRLPSNMSKKDSNRFDDQFSSGGTHPRQNFVYHRKTHNIGSTRDHESTSPPKLNEGHIVCCALLQR